jgi:hypothetical protein
MNWMLVLFMGVSPHYNVVKTDLVFTTIEACFAYEKTMAERSVESVNYYLKDRKKDGDNSMIDQSVIWVGMQLPRGTCIPTTLKKTVD